MYFLTDWIKRIDFDRMRSERIRKVSEEMALFGLDGLLALRAENIRYLTGLRPGWFPYFQIRNAALFMPNKDPVCFVDEADLEHRRRTIYWLKEENIRSFFRIDDQICREKGIRTLVEAIRDFGLTQGRIGVDILTLPILNSLKKAFPKVDFVDGDGCVKKARMIKNQEEIKAMRLSSICVDMGMNALMRSAKPGRRECELLGEATRIYCSLGMEIAQCQSIVASGEENLVPLARFASDKIVRHGELVFVDIGGCFNGMYAEMTRTFICGTPNPDQKKIYQTVYKALKAVIDAMKPGASSEEVYEAQLEVYRRENMERFAHLTLLGHGIGIGGTEPPSFGDPSITTNRFELKPGMVFSIEPTLIVPGVAGGGGVRIEDEILITEDGNEVLTKTPYDEKLLS